MSHVMYTCTHDDLVALDAVADKLKTSREAVVAAAVEAYVAKPPKKIVASAPGPEPEAAESASASQGSRKEK